MFASFRKMVCLKSAEFFSVLYTPQRFFVNCQTREADAVRCEWRVECDKERAYVVHQESNETGAIFFLFNIYL